MRRLLFEFVLWPLIKRNLRRREAGIAEDKWYWADMLAIKLGMLDWYRVDELTCGWEIGDAQVDT